MHRQFQQSPGQLVQLIDLFGEWFCQCTGIFRPPSSPTLRPGLSATLAPLLLTSMDKHYCQGICLHHHHHHHFTHNPTRPHPPLSPPPSPHTHTTTTRCLARSAFSRFVGNVRTSAGPQRETQRCSRRCRRRHRQCAPLERERRLRSFLRHERMAVAMALADRVRTIPQKGGSRFEEHGQVPEEPPPQATVLDRLKVGPSVPQWDANWTSEVFKVHAQDKVSRRMRHASGGILFTRTSSVTCACSSDGVFLSSAPAVFSPANASGGGHLTRAGSVSCVSVSGGVWSSPWTALNSAWWS